MIPRVLQTSLAIYPSSVSIIVAPSFQLNVPFSLLYDSYHAIFLSIFKIYLLSK